MLSSSSTCHRVRIRVRSTPQLCSTCSTKLTINHRSDGQENGTVVPGLPVPDKYVKTSTSVPQPGLDNRTSVLYTGASVGGGTVVNGMFFNRGSAADYDAWERLGNQGWGWTGLLPYFKKVRTSFRMLGDGWA
jgi:choline dehydrogenase-like flavoprotein